MDTLDDLMPFILCLLPVPLVAWAWARWHRHRLEAAGRMRARLTLCSLVLATTSCALLVVFPWLLNYFDSQGGGLADEWYRRGVQVGFGASVGAMLSSLFAIGGLRLILAGAGLLMLCLWFLVGVAS
jgi:hypothetical protein